MKDSYSMCYYFMKKVRLDNNSSSQIEPNYLMTFMDWVNQSEASLLEKFKQTSPIHEMGPLSKLIMIQHIPLNSINNHDSYSASIG